MGHKVHLLRPPGCSFDRRMDAYWHLLTSCYRIFLLLQANPGVVTTLDNRMHGFQTGDKVTFKEIVGMSALNGTEHTIKG